METGNKKQEQD